MSPAGTSKGTDSLLDEWVLWMDGCSARTINERVYLVRRFLAETETDPLTCDWRPVATFLAGDWSPGTRSTYRASLNAWFDWLARMDFRDANPMRKMRRARAPRYQPRPVTTDEVRRLLATVNRRRTRAMILLAAFQGLRAHEIAKIRGDDFTGGILEVVGKGSKKARIPIHPVVDDLRPWMPTRGLWFPSYADPRKPIGYRSVSTVVSGAMRRAGIHGTCHQLRHWYGTQALAHSHDLRTVQELMRHESPATTAKYTAVSDERRREVLAGLPLAEDASAILAIPRRSRSVLNGREAS